MWHMLTEDFTVFMESVPGNDNVFVIQSRGIQTCRRHRDTGQDKIEQTHLCRENHLDDLDLITLEATKK